MEKWVPFWNNVQMKCEMVMREPALPLGQTAQANKLSLCTDNPGSTSLVLGYVSEEYGRGL